MTHDTDEHAPERDHMMSPYGMPADDGEPPKEGDVIRAGSPLDRSQHTVASEDAVIEALRTIYDPEIPVNIYDLGLIYEIKIQDTGNVDIVMTLTAPACPVAGSLPKEVADVVANAQGVGEVGVTITWDPPWTQANMSEVARVALDMF